MTFFLFSGPLHTTTLFRNTRPPRPSLPTPPPHFTTPTKRKTKQTNELRKITHVLTADVQQAEIYQKQEEQSSKVSSAAALLADTGNSGTGSTESDGDSAIFSVARNAASLRGATVTKNGGLRLYRPNPARATPERELQEEWAVEQSAELRDSDGETVSQVRAGNGTSNDSTFFSNKILRMSGTGYMYGVVVKTNYLLRLRHYLSFTRQGDEICETGDKVQDKQQH